MKQAGSDRFVVKFGETFSVRGDFPQSESAFDPAVWMACKQRRHERTDFPWKIVAKQSCSGKTIEHQTRVDVARSSKITAEFGCRVDQFVVVGFQDVDYGMFGYAREHNEFARLGR